MFGVLNNPDEDDFAGRNGVVRIAGDKIADMRNLMGNTDASGEEQNCAIGVKVLVAIRTFQEGCGGKATARGFLSFLPEAVREAGAATDDEGYCGPTNFEDVSAILGKSFLHRHVLFFFGPSHGERVIGEEADGGHVDVSVLSRVEPPRACELHGNAYSVTRKNFAFCMGSAVADIAVSKFGDARQSLEDPEYDDSDENRLHVCILLEVVPEGADDQGSQKYVESEECFIERVTNC